jgi:hypothetical protein
MIKKHGNKKEALVTNRVAGASISDSGSVYTAQNIVAVAACWG